MKHKQLFVEAYQLMHQGELQRARDIFERIVNEFPGTPEASRSSDHLVIIVEKLMARVQNKNESNVNPKQLDPPQGGNPISSELSEVSPGNKSVQPAPVSPRYCTQCGVPIEPGDKFCANCGAKIRVHSNNSHQTVKRVERNNGEVRPELKRPHPWLRYFARVIDFAWFGLVMTGFAHFVAPEKIFLVRSSDFNALWSVAVLWAWCFVEPLFLAVMGFTPGKWLCGLSLTPYGQDQARYGIYLHRSLLVLARGMGLGVPLFNVICLIWSYKNLAASGETYWDNKLKISVNFQKPSIIQTTGAITVFVVVTAAYVYWFG